MENAVIYLHNASIYQQDFPVLTDVSLNVNEGDFVYLVGKTGSGKSSLLKTLYGDLSLQEGEGRVAGYDLTKLNKRRIPYLRRKLGIVFQDFQLLTDRTVADNLIFVMKATGWKNKKLIEKRLEEVLGLVGLATKAYKMPHNLSGGEQQRVVIARALLNDPMVILADEPTGNLDPEISEDIIKLLRKISNGGTAVIMASHDFSIMNKYKARTIRVAEGKIYTVE